MHKCDEADYAKFNTIVPNQKKSFEKYKDNNYLMCLDYTD